MGLKRRDVLIGGAGFVLTAVATPVLAAHHKIRSALRESPLVYLTLHHADGRAAARVRSGSLCLMATP